MGLKEKPTIRDFSDRGGSGVGMENDGFQSRVSQFQLQSTQLQMQNANVNSNGLRFLMALMEKKSLIRNSC